MGVQATTTDASYQTCCHSQSSGGFQQPHVSYVLFKNVYEIGLIILLKKTDLNLFIYW